MGSVWDLPSLPNCNIPSFVESFTVMREQVPQPAPIKTDSIDVQNFYEDIRRSEEKLLR